MRWFFLIPLITSLTTVYISQRTADEIAYLTGAFAVLSLFISLVMAPWQIQVLILVIGFLIARQLWRKLEDPSGQGREQRAVGDRFLLSQNLETSIPAVPAETTRKYRGVSYETTSASNITAIETEGKYRGSPCKVHSYQQADETPPNVELERHLKAGTSSRPVPPQSSTVPSPNSDL